MGMLMLEIGHIQVHATCRFQGFSGKRAVMDQVQPCLICTYPQIPRRQPLQRLPASQTRLPPPLPSCAGGVGWAQMLLRLRRPASGLGLWARGP